MWKILTTLLNPTCRESFRGYSPAGTICMTERNWYIQEMVDLKKYQFALPDELIAKTPANPRESAKLFIYNTKTDEVSFDTFSNISQYLPKPSLLVWNNTKVVPARLWLTKKMLEESGKKKIRRGGGRVGVLLMLNEYHHGDTELKGMLEGKVDAPSRLFGNDGVYFDVTRREERFFFFKPSFPVKDIWKFLEREGETPIPPYIAETPLSEASLRAEYQSVLAKYPASVAAPTASLHFSTDLLRTMSESGITSTEVTLHVGAGTFAPITDENFATKKLFTEYYDVPKEHAEVINSAKHADIPVIPVGTTALRTLESSASLQGPTFRKVNEGMNKTNIFIFPPYEFKIADGLITNFHIPGSSLLLLVEAFLTHKNAKRNILELYGIAITERFRFYSFGDGMLIL